MAQGESLGQAIADESRSALDAYFREGARQMLQRALECEVAAFLAEYADRADEHGRKQVVRNGYLPARHHHDWCRAARDRAAAGAGQVAARR